MSPPRRLFTSDEVIELRYLVGKFSIRAIASIFHCRQDTVRREIAALHIPYTPPLRRQLTDDELVRLRSLLAEGQYTIAEIARLLSRCRQTVHKKLKELGLHNPRPRQPPERLNSSDFGHNPTAASWPSDARFS